MSISHSPAVSVLGGFGNRKVFYHGVLGHWSTLLLVLVAGCWWDAILESGASAIAQCFVGGGLQVPP
jgi:hypothetical protein